MTVEKLVERLRAEATCPLCREDFKDPVITSCGHSFCQACVAQRWEGLDTSFPCPQCREPAPQRNLRPNRQLAVVLAIARELSLQVVKGAGGESLCREHQEPLKLFCEADQAPICVVCDRSRAHRAHPVVPIEEATQEYKEKIQAHLETLREEREKLLRFKVTGEGKSQEYLIQTETEREKIVSEFQQLQKFLEEQERLLLGQLENLEKEILKIQNDNVTKLSAEVSCLSELLREMEEKCQKPPSEFLQDVRSTLIRYEMRKFHQPMEISPELEERLSDFFQKNMSLMEILRKFKGYDKMQTGNDTNQLGRMWEQEMYFTYNTLCSEIQTKRGKFLGSYRPVNVTLDPDTAHPQLVLSEDWKSACWEHTWQALPGNLERFDTEFCVLSCEGFTSGKHSWEVEVGEGRRWAVGVARECVRRKGWISHSPDGGIWAVQRWGGQFQALTFPEAPLPLTRVPRRVRVCLDYEWGQVAFFDADDEAPIFTFPPASFRGERIHPWFWVWTGSWLRLCT